jgi:hypothetical protein
MNRGMKISENDLHINIKQILGLKNKWWGHTERMEENHVPDKDLKIIHMHKTKIGRPSYYLRLIADRRLVGKLHFSGLENCVLLQDGGLRLVVSKRLQHPTLHWVNSTINILMLLRKCWEKKYQKELKTHSAINTSISTDV